MPQSDTIPPTLIGKIRASFTEYPAFQYRLGRILFAVGVLVTVLTAANVRSLLFIAILGGLAFTVLLLVLSWVALRAKIPPALKFQMWRWMVVDIFVLALVLGLYGAGLANTWTLVESWVPLLPWEPIGFNLLRVAIVGAAGAMFFLFRLKARGIYGAVEVLIGLSIGAFKLSNSFNAEVAFAVVTAGVYLVVRGLDNIHQAWKANPDDPLFRIWSAWKGRLLTEAAASTTPQETQSTEQKT